MEIKYNFKHGIGDVVEWSGIHCGVVCGLKIIVDTWGDIKPTYIVSTINQVLTVNEDEIVN